MRPQDSKLQVRLGFGFPLPQNIPLAASSLMAENHHSSGEEPVCTAWTRLVEVVLGVFLIVGTVFMGRYYSPPAPLPIPPNPVPATALVNDHREELQQLTRDVDELKQEQAMPALVLHRYRNSICYIFGIYHVGFPAKPAPTCGPAFQEPASWWPTACWPPIATWPSPGMETPSRTS